MGHYRSEMGLEPRDEENRLHRVQKRAELIAALNKRLSRGDLAEVIADIIEELEFWEAKADRVIRRAE